MKLPQAKPNSNAFMVFSMLLLGFFAAALVLVFDFLSGSDGRTISAVLLRKLSELNVPLPWVASVAGLTMMASGFFFYLLSFFALAPPAFLVRSIAHRSSNTENDLFLHVSQSALERYLPPDVARRQNRKFRDGFMYMLLTSQESVISSTARFAFTQLMYARALGVVFLLFTAYVNWVFASNAITAGLTIATCWVAMSALYGVGLGFYERLMTSGILIEQLHKSHQLQTLMSAEDILVKKDRRRRRPTATSDGGEAGNVHSSTNE